MPDSISNEQPKKLKLDFIQDKELVKRYGELLLPEPTFSSSCLWASAESSLEDGIFRGIYGFMG